MAEAANSRATKSTETKANVLLIEYNYFYRVLLVICLTNIYGCPFSLSFSRPPYNIKFQLMVCFNDVCQMNICIENVINFMKFSM